jgi:dipeptidase E
MNRRVLLISNSTSYGNGYLDHCEAEMRSFLGPVERVAFIPLALFDRKAYAEKARTRLAAMGYRVESILEPAGARAVLDATQAIFIGGGNTFRLLHALYAFDLLGPITRLVDTGIPYIGSSAGSIVAGPSLKTTKDMPILQPPSFDALNLVPFQISPHYLDPEPGSTHMGETQEERILQFLEENSAPVVGLREGAMICVEGSSAVLKGPTGARIFRRGRPPAEARAGAALDDLLAAGAAA